jgi:hypothetical protein
VVPGLCRHKSIGNFLADTAVFTVCLLRPQRKYSSFALAKGPGYYPWKDVFTGRDPKPDSPFPLWFHCTGITPLVSESAYSNWNESLQYARALNIPISFDLNHRPALGTLETLWGYVSPHIASFQLVVLAQSNLQPLIKLMALESDLAVRWYRHSQGWKWL